MELYLMRHPAVDVPKSLCYGQTNVPLKPGYQTVLDGVRKQLPNIEELDVVSSPLSRCHLAAQYLAGREPAFDDDLKELDFGQWEGKYWNEIPEADIRAWADDFSKHPPPGGETVAAFRSRIDRFWNRFLESQHPTLAVSHTGVIRFLLANLLEIPDMAVFKMNIDFCGLTLIKLSGENARVVYINR